MKNRTLKSIFSLGRASAKKVVSVLVAIVLCVCMLVPMTSSGALSANAGIAGHHATIYSPLDMLPTSADNYALSADTFNKDGSDVWQFEVEKQVSDNFDLLSLFDDQDFFADTVEGFAAPTVAATGNGIEVSVSWTAQDPAPEYYTVKVVNLSATDADIFENDISEVATEYKVIGTSNSVVIGDLKENTNYYFQVVAGNKGSKLASFGSGSAAAAKSKPATVYGIDGDGGSGNLTTNLTKGGGEGGMYWIVDVADALDYFTNSGALVFKFRTDYTKTDVDVTIDSSTTVRNQDLKLVSNFWFNTVNPTWSDANEKWYYPDGDFTNIMATTTDKFIFADKDMNYIASASATSSGSQAFGYSAKNEWSTTGFATGYMVLPLSGWTSEYLTAVQSKGNKIKINCSSIRYNYNGSNLNGTQLPTASSMNDKDLWDRTITLESVDVVEDYTQFCKDNSLVESAGDGTVEAATDLVPEVTGGNIVYSKDGWTSSYVFSDYAATGDRWWQTFTTNRTGIVWKAAKGEKMRFGFKAPAEGVYEIAAPIEADADVSVVYAVSKVDAATGSKTYIQDWNWDYVGDGLTSTDRSGKTYPDQFCDLQVELKTGDTVYLEAFADTNGASVNICVPTAMKLADSIPEGETESVYTYKLSDYIWHQKNEDGSYKNGNDRSAVPQTDAAWQLGYYANKISDTADLSAITIATLDPNGMIDMAAGDDFANVGDLFQHYTKLTLRDKTNYDLHPWDVGSTTDNQADNRQPAGDGKPGSVNIGGKRAVTTQTEDTAGYKVCLGYQPQFTWSSYDSDSRRVAKGSWNVSSMLKFTAPISGTGKLRLDNGAGMASSGQIHNAGWWVKALVVQNGTVIGNYNAVKNVVIDLDLAKGDEIYIVYYVDWNKGKLSTTGGSSRLQIIGNPYMEIIDNDEYVTVDTDGGNAINSINFLNTSINPANAEPLYVPLTATKVAAIFDCWNDGTDDLSEDAELTAAGNITAKWLYLGDADGNGTIGTAEDIMGIRAAVLNNDSTRPTTNVNGDDVVNIADLLRIKRYNAGIAGIRN